MALAAPEPQIGTVVSISAAAPSAEDQSGYEALSYTEIGGVVSIPEISENAEEGSVVKLKDGITQRYNGARGVASFDISYIYDSADTGQGIVRSNYNGSTEVSIKIAYASGVTKYVWGVLGNLRTQEASANSYHGEMVRVSPSSEAVTVTS